MEVYLDNSATTRPSEEAVAAINHALNECYGNPSSLHRYGLAAERLLKDARHKVASLLNSAADEIIFTSGGTEANNLAIFGATAGLRDTTRPLVTTEIEHASVLNVFKHFEKSGRRVIYLKVNSQGFVDLEEFLKALQENPSFISIMSVNNEIGSIQPIPEFSKLIPTLDDRPLFHTDAVQALGKIELHVKQEQIDFLSVSSHKIHGPKGVGALFVRRGTKLAAMTLGGSQESGLRPGTENLPGITGMGAAADWAGSHLHQNMTDFNRMKQKIIVAVTESISGVRVNSPVSPQFAPHILSLSFRGVRGEVLLHSLEQDQIYISTRSACTSRKKSLSHVLQALKLTPEEIEGTIRISFSRYNDDSQIDYFLERLQYHVAAIRRITGWRR